MPLLDIVGVDACQKTFCIAFAFLDGETELDYSWVLEQLKELYLQSDIRLPSVILTDCCRAIINAIAFVFPRAIALLCLWHADKAVVRHCQPSITARDGHEAWLTFFKL